MSETGHVSLGQMLSETLATNPIIRCWVNISNFWLRLNYTWPVKLYVFGCKQYKIFHKAVSEMVLIWKVGSQEVKLNVFRPKSLSKGCKLMECFHQNEVLFDSDPVEINNLEHRYLLGIQLTINFMILNVWFS